MKKTAPHLILLLVTGCMSFSTFDRAFPLLMRQNIKMSIDYLGIPDQEYVVAGRQIYVWNSSTGSAEQMNCRIKMSTENDIVQRIEYNGNNAACFTYSDRLKPLLDNSSERSKP